MQGLKILFCFDWIKTHLWIYTMSINLFHPSCMVWMHHIIQPTVKEVTSLEQRPEATLLECALPLPLCIFPVSVELRGEHEWNSPILHLSCFWSRHKPLWKLRHRDTIFVAFGLWITCTRAYIFLPHEFISAWLELFDGHFLHFLCTTKHIALFYMNICSRRFLSIHFALIIHRNLICEALYIF